VQVRTLLPRNDEYPPFLQLTASCVYQNYDPTLEQGPLQVVSSFRALHEMVQVFRDSGLVLDWKQSSGVLPIGGDPRTIRA
jgi:regulator-associated protein of mTOR